MTAIIISVFLLLLLGLWLTMELGCGLCVSHFPTDAMKLILAPHKGIPLNIERWHNNKGV